MTHVLELSSDELFHVTRFIDSTYSVNLKLVCSAWYHGLTPSYLYSQKYRELLNKQLEELQLFSNMEANMLKESCTQSLKELQRSIQLKQKDLKRLETEPHADWAKIYKMKVFSDKIRGLYDEMRSICTKLREHFYTSCSEPFQQIIALTKVTISDKKMNSAYHRAISIALQTTHTYMQENTILHQLIFGIKKWFKNMTKDQEQEILQLICNIVEASRLNGKSCLTITNHVQLSPMHLVILSRKKSIISAMLQRYALELKECKFNQVQTIKETAPIIVTERSLYRFYLRLRGSRFWSTLQRPNFSLLHMMLCYYSGHENIELLNNLGICNVAELVKQPCPKSGFTCLHYLMRSFARSNCKRGLQNSMLRTARYLIKKGNDVNTTDKYGFSAMAFLMENYIRCYMKQSFIMPMIKLLVQYCPNALSHRMPSTKSHRLPSTKTVFEAIFEDWKFNLSQLEWMVTSGNTALSQEKLDKILQNVSSFVPDSQIGKKVQFITTHQQKPKLILPAKLKKNWKVETKKQYEFDFWDDALFRKRL
jgi:hypothetical protein